MIKEEVKMKGKQKFSNCRLVSSTIKTISINDIVDAKFNFSKGTVTLQNGATSVKFNDLAEVNMNDGKIIIGFNDGSNMILKPVENKSEPVEIKQECTEESAGMKCKKRQTIKSASEGSWADKPCFDKIMKMVDDYAVKSNKIMNALEDHLESSGNASDASVMLANKQARFYDGLNDIISEFAKIAPNLFELTDLEIKDALKRRASRDEEEEKNQEVEYLNGQIEELEVEVKKLENEIESLQSEIGDLEEEKDRLKMINKAIRKRNEEMSETDVREETAITPVNDEEEETKKTKKSKKDSKK
jgi:regulator of replication initiation timing